ncbi:DUF2782 domain-containing protein [Luteimonas sp. RD2P54]|uniref:DUF2782 domain-containing protein n=1 Tax=Luteimonas endophytica TaxID=3042023 RepID=A0ABT6J5M0_9GAMM|nr:DUF2782 domain-containing protein [Luteimonas endophytica]MDH5822064.1 DUF2782 domain-containing protein [Luteimonas endophytica]
MKFLLLIPLLALAACATVGAPDRPEVPANAVENTRTEPNGDVITEYRVGNQLRMVRVQPARGPEYFLYDRDGDGSLDSDIDDPPQTYFELFEW